MLHSLILLILFTLQSCLNYNQITITASKQSLDNTLTINQAVNENVGTCVFTAPQDPTSVTGFSYRVSFPNPIEPSTFTASDVTNLGAGGSSTLVWTVDHCGDNRNFKLTATTVVGDGPIIPAIANQTVKAVDNQVSFDTTPPSVTINQAVTETTGSCGFTSYSDPISSPGFSYRVSFSEAINPSTFTTSDVVNSGSGGSSLTWSLANCGDDRNFKLTATAVSGVGTIIPNLPAASVTDKAGNPSLLSTATDNSVTFSLGSFVAVSIDQAITETIGSCSFVAPADPSNVVGFSYRVTFSGAIDATTFTTSDITNAGTGGAGTLTWSLTNCGDDRNFKLTATAITGNGTIIPTIASSVVQNNGGDQNSSSTATDNTVTFDTTVPTVSINQATTETVGTCSFASVTEPTGSAGFAYKVLFSEAISLPSFTTSDIVNSGTGGSSLTWTLSNCGDDRTFKLTATAVSGSGTIVPTIAASSVQDLAGNNNSTSTATDNSVLFDNVSPTVSINQAISQTVGTCTFTAVSDPERLPGFSYRVSFSEPINAASFATTDIVNAGTGGSVVLSWTLSNCGDNQNFKLTATSISPNGTIVPTLPSGTVLDAAGNANLTSSATDNTVTFDSTSPNVTVNQSVAETIGTCSFTATSDPALAAGFSYRVTFSEPISVASFTTADVANSGTGGGTLLTWNLASCSDQRNFMLTAQSITGDGTIVPNITLASVSDIAGNTNTASTATDNIVTFDANAPTVTVNQAIAETVGTCSFTATSDPSSSTGFSYRVRFSERIDTSTFTTSDIVNSGTGGSTTLTWSLSDCGDQTNFKLTATAITGNGTIVPSIAVNTVKDVVGHDNAASTSTDNSVTFNAGSGWVQEAYIKASNADIFDGFGTVVFISGNTLAVSAPAEDSAATTITNGAGSSADNSGTDLGAVYVYKRTGLVWAQEAYIKAVNGNNGDLMGDALAIHGDTLAVGVQNEASTQNTITNGTTASADNANLGGGAVYVYKRTGSTWAQEAYIKPSNSSFNEEPGLQKFFGKSVSLTNNTLAVGSPGDSSLQNTITNGSTSAQPKLNENAGAVFVYSRSGTTWSQEAYIKASNDRSSSYFGESVSLSGNSLAVGAWGNQTAQTTITNGQTSPGNFTSNLSGAVYVYTRRGITWYQEAFIKASNNEAYDQFGERVSLSGDGLAVGTYSEDSNQTTITNGTTSSAANSAMSSGAVYVYKRTGTTWAQEAYIKPSNNEAGDLFGKSLSLNGSTLVVSSPYEDSDQTTITNGPTASADNTIAESGAVYVFKRTGASWAQEAYIKASNNGLNDAFGSSVSLSGDTIAVGAPFEDSSDTTITNGTTASIDESAMDAGAVYVYRNTSRVFEPVDVSFTVTTTAINLQWQKISGATGYTVSSQAGTSVPVNCVGGTAAGDVTSYSLSSLTSGTTYAVRVCATNGASTSEGVLYLIQTKETSQPIMTSFAAAVTETIGKCAFTAMSEPVTTDGVSFKITFNERVNPSSFTREDIVNSGGSIPDADILWDVIDCGDGMTYMLRATSVASSGTLGPEIGFGAFLDDWGNTNFIFNSLYPSVTYNFSGWYQEAYIKAANAEEQDAFGSSVSLSGETLAVGAPNEDSNQTSITNGPTASANNSASNAGAVYVYKRSTNTWAQEAYIKASNAGLDRSFGQSVSLQLDTLAVGSYRDSSGQTTITNGTTSDSSTTINSSGSVFVYKRSGSNWTQEAYIKPSNPEYQGFFGREVSLHGNLLAVSSSNSSSQTTITYGTSLATDTGSTGSGAVYIYSRTGANWTQDAFIKAVNNGSGDKFGSAIQLYKDTLIVSAIEEDSAETTITNGPTAASDNTAINSGAVFVYRKAGATWYQEAYIKAVNSGPSLRYGTSVSLFGDSLTISASNEDSSQSVITNGDTASTDRSAAYSGAVYVYTRYISDWTQEAYIKSMNNREYQYHGSDVVISGDTLVVGSVGQPSNQSTITNGELASDDYSSPSSGAVYVYKRTGTTWTQESFIKPSNTNDGLFFGQNVALSGDTIAVSTPYDSSNQTSITNGRTSSLDLSKQMSGAVYVYRNKSRLFEVSDLYATPGVGSITLRWSRSGGTATNYSIAYAAGSTPPGNCLGGSVVDLGNVDTYTFTVPSGTTHSYRVCSSSGADYSPGETITERSQ